MGCQKYLESYALPVGTQEDSRWKGKSSLRCLHSHALVLSFSGWLQQHWRYPYTHTMLVEWYKASEGSWETWTFPSEYSFLWKCLCYLGGVFCPRISWMIKSKSRANPCKQGSVLGTAVLLTACLLTMEVAVRQPKRYFVYIYILFLSLFFL